MVEPVKGVAVLGSTGSVGTQALEVLASLSDRFQVIALAAGHNIRLLEQQIRSFNPSLVSSASASERLTQQKGCRVSSLVEMASDPRVDIVMVATSGITGLAAAVAALEHGKVVAIANKEILVIAGGLLRRAAERGGGELRPVDSEHSAIWQCLWGEKGRPIRLILTASGGALRDRSLAELASVLPEEALRHPTWQMGPKITIDSASLLNKGLETIEAHWLFDVPLAQIEVVMHRESIVHSLVEFADGSVKAQLGYPDMRLPVQCALTYPDRLPSEQLRPLDLVQVGNLSFESVDLQRFPCLDLAMGAGKRGGTFPAVLVAADEVAVEHFLAGQIGFMEIPELIEGALAAHEGIEDPTSDQILESVSWARAWTQERLPRKNHLAV